MECELTILMPCLNEAETLASCIVKAKSFLVQEEVKGEILIADNGSSDGSQDIARACGARVISVVRRGYGAALKQGIEAAQGRFVIMGDADDSYNFIDLKPFLTRLREGYDLVMGNRFKGGIAKGAMPFLNRYLGNPVLSFIGRIFFKSEIHDFHCGLRGFNKQSLLKLSLQGEGMEYASEMVVMATLNQFKIIEVPTHLYPDGRSKTPHLRPWRDGWRHLRLLLLFSPRWLFFYPGLFLMLLGCFFMGLLFFGPISLGGYHLDIHTMQFASLAIIIGFQGVCFSLFTWFLNRLYLSSFLGLKKFYDFFTLERGLATAALFIFIGLTGTIYTFWFWAYHAFGPLIPTQMMRVLIPAMTSVILGVQILFSSFFSHRLNVVYTRQQDTIEWFDG